MRAPSASARASPPGRDRVEVADGDVDAQTDRERVVDARVGRPPRDLGAGGRRGRGGGGRPGNDDNTAVAHVLLPPLALPSSGSVGRWRLRPPSQPGCPELPMWLVAETYLRSRSLAMWVIWISSVPA